MSHNSDNPQPDLPFRLTGSQAKTAFALRHNAEVMIREAGLERAGFLTLTVGDQGERFAQVWDAAEASRRINNLARRVLPEIFERSIIVTERHKSGAIHFHLLGVCRADIRSGFDFVALHEHRDTRANGALRALWALLRDRLPEYGFGRAQLTPVEKTGAAVATYVSKYVEKNIFNRLAEDRRKKLVRYIGWTGRHLRPNDFGWVSARATAWRVKAAQLAGLVGVRDRGEVQDAFGPRWAFRLTTVMHAIDDSPDPTGFHFDYAERESARQIVARKARRSWLGARERADGRLPFEWRPNFRRDRSPEFAWGGAN